MEESWQLDIKTVRILTASMSRRQISARPVKDGRITSKSSASIQNRTDPSLVRENSSKTRPESTLIPTPRESKEGKVSYSFFPLSFFSPFLSSNKGSIRFVYTIKFVCSLGSFQVVDSSTLDDIVGFHHRKEEISDIKFSPGKTFWFCIERLGTRTSAECVAAIGNEIQGIKYQ